MCIQVDFYGVTSCPSCALPSSEGRSTCAFCERVLFVQTPLLARLARTGDGITFTSGTEILASAVRDGDLWTTQVQGGPSLTQVALHDETGIEVVVLDAELNIVASLRPSGATMTPSAVVFDAMDRVSIIVRGDGSGGLHGMAPGGEILFFAGRSRADLDSLDVLLTDTGLSTPLSVIVAALIALEVERFGPLFA